MKNHSSTLIETDESHVAAMNFLDKLIISRMEELRNRGLDPVVTERYAKQWK